MSMFDIWRPLWYDESAMTLFNLMWVRSRVSLLVFLPYFDSYDHLVVPNLGHVLLALVILLAHRFADLLVFAVAPTKILKRSCK